MAEEIISQEILIKTQKTLGKYVKKPVLSEKLLRKPPFRFLHDIIKCVIKETGFLTGLFSHDELNSDKVKDKESKIVFLTKLIDAIKVLSKTDLKVRPNKIVAGLEPQETNILLQTIGKCIDKKIDSKEYVTKLHKKVTSATNSKESNNKKTIRPNKNDTKKIPDSKITKQKNKTPVVTTAVKTTETPKSSKTNNTERVVEPANTDNKQIINEQIINVINNNVKINNEEEKILPENPISIESEQISAPHPQAESVPAEEAPKVEFSNARQSSAGLTRPKSARPKSGKNQIITKNLRPPSVRPSSARPGAPRLRPDSAMLNLKEPTEIMGNIKVIVENFDSGIEEDTTTTVIIQNDPVDEIIHVENDEIINGANQGQLVEEILEQINNTEGIINNSSMKKVDIEWENDGLKKGRDATIKEITHLRNSIQLLTKSANPLGKLMNYLHEDLDAMQNELIMWTNTKKQLYSEIEKQKKLAEEFSKPLNEKLIKIKKDMGKQENEITIIRGNILKNEQRILELLS